MGKRVNENGQMKKDDYDDDAPGEKISYGIPKASEEVLKKRKILKVGSKFGASPGSGASASGGPFGGINLKTGSSPAPAPAAGGVFGGLNMVAGSTSKPAAAAPAIAAPGLGFMQNMPLPPPRPAGEQLTAEQQAQVMDLTKRYLEHSRALPLNVNDSVGRESFIITYNSIVHPRQVVSSFPLAPAAAPAAPPAPSAAPPAAAPAPAANNLFSGGGGGFNFGGAPASSAPASSTSLFSGGSLFNGSAAAPAASAQSLFPAPSPAPAGTSTTGFGGFSTAPSPAVAAQAAAPTKEAGEDDDNEEGEVTEKALANPDANVHVAFESNLVKVFRIVEGKRVMIAAGGLKLERNRATGFSQAIIRDETTGILKLNFAVFSDLKYLEKKTPKGKASVQVYAKIKGGNPEGELFYMTSLDKNLELFKAMDDFKKEAPASKKDD